MNIIGINHGHNASIGLAINDKIVFAINEERLRRIKNFFGIPMMSLEYCYKNFIKKEDVDYFVLFHDTFNDFFMASFFGNDEQMTEYEALRRQIVIKLVKFLSLDAMKKIFYYCEYLFFPEPVRRRYFSKKLGISGEKIIFANHHLCHAQSAAFSLDIEKDWLIFTSDGEGDLECASVYKKEKHDNNLIKLTSIHRDHSLGYFFLFITQFMGMKPNEHEYKAMGLINEVNSLNDTDTKQGHRRVYTIEELKKDVTLAGLKISEEGSFFIKPFSNGQMELIDKRIVDALYDVSFNLPFLGSMLYIKAEV